MRRFLARLRPRHLVAAAIAYWALLLIVVLGRAAVAARQLSLRGEHGTATLGVDEGRVFLGLQGGGRMLWSGSTSTVAALLWLLLPPLALWALWAARRPSRAEMLAALDEHPMLQDTQWNLPRTPTEELRTGDPPRR